MPRTLIWWSTGAASAVMAQLMLWRKPDAIIVRCETGNEDPDNYRFEADIMRLLNRTMTLLKSDEYEDVWDVWQKRRYMSGIAGAPCTAEMKIKPRLEFQRPTDIHVFGYTADAEDVDRFERLKANYPELTVRVPLIDQGDAYRHYGDSKRGPPMPFEVAMTLAWFTLLAAIPICVWVAVSWFF